MFVGLPADCDGLLRLTIIQTCREPNFYSGRVGEFSKGILCCETVLSPLVGLSAARLLTMAKRRNRI
jgi:hypothetical protein